ncbi:MAG: hypothetical protein KKE24_05830 [Candidatus Thermoplasmatota archaeon]|nr:hypothetical protein [Candidatus Thermoplasmatota archaeon]
MGLSVTRRVLIILNNSPDKWFTIDHLIRNLSLESKKPRRNTVYKALARFETKGLIQRSGDARDELTFRVKDSGSALSIIQNQSSRHWQKVPPTLGRAPFLTQNRHRVTYKVALSETDLEIAREVGEFRNGKQNRAMIVIKVPSMSLSISAASGKGQIWLRNGWEEAIRSFFSKELLDDLKNMVANREGHEHLSLPVELVNRRIRVGGSDVVLAGSHYPVEIDIQGPENDDDKTRVIKMLVDSTEFNKTLIETRNAQVKLSKSMKVIESELGALTKAMIQAVEILQSINRNHAYHPISSSPDSTPDISYR